MLKKDNRFDDSDSSSPNSSPPNQGISGLPRNTAPTDSALNDILSRLLGEDVFKRAALNIPPNGLLNFVHHVFHIPFCLQYLTVTQRAENEC